MHNTRAPLETFGRPRLAAAIVLGAFAALTAPAPAQPHGELIAWNVARFVASEEAAQRPRHSPIFFRQPEHFAPLPGDFPFAPAWAREESLTIITLAIPDNASLYGLGRAPGSLVRADARFEGAAVSPWLMGVRDNGAAFGIILDTTWSSAFELDQARIRIETPDPDPALIVLDLTAPAELVTALGGLTGPIEMPALWSLGILTSAAPGAPSFPYVEAAFLDCELALPDPAEHCLDTPVADELSHAQQKRIAHGPLAVSRDAARKLDEPDGRPAWVQDDAGEPLELDGRLIPDFTDPGTRQWWGRQMAAFADRGAAGIAAPFDDYFAQIPPDARLAGDPQLGGAGPASKYAGIFGLLAARSTWETFDPEAHDRRALFVIPTAALSAQRWTVHLIRAGSPDAPSPRHLLAAALNSSLTAQPLVGASLPGPEAMDEQQWNRWLSAAALLPVLHLQGLPPQRCDVENDESKLENHKSSGGNDFLSAVARLRTQLLPHLYTLAFQNFFQGDLILRPLYLHDPDDAALRNIETAFMLGRDLLVVPPLGKETFRHEDSFAGVWRKLDVGAADPRLPALYLRPGSIIPIAPDKLRASEWRLDPLTIIISLDVSGQAVGILYEDEWDNYGLFRGQTRRLTYHAIQQDDVILVRLQGMDGGWGMPQRRLLVRVLTDNGELRAEGSERGTIRIPVNPDPAPSR